MKSTLCIGLLGSAFDPIHFGHLRAALEIEQNIGLDEVRFIPCKVAVHKPNSKIEMTHRLEMLKLAIASQPSFKIDERELLRITPSYTVETLQSLREEYPNASLCLLLGMDAFLGLPTWHEWQKIETLAHMIVIQRPGAIGAMEPSFSHWVKSKTITDPKQLKEKKSGCIFFQDPINALDISSSLIREQFEKGLSPRYLLPDPVLEYIYKHGLYV